MNGCSEVRFIDRRRASVTLLI